MAWTSGNNIGLSWGGYYQAQVQTSVSNISNTTSRVTVQVRGYFYEYTGWSGSTLTISGTTVYSGNYYPSPSPTGYGGTYSKTYDVTRTHSAQSKSYNGTVYCGYGTSTATQSASIPAKPSYAITYNANGGSGTTASQTKWYGETLTLQQNAFTRVGYDFLGWATSASGDVAYAGGASYTTDSAQTFYAVWQPQAASISSALDITMGDSVEIKWTPIIADHKFKLTFSIGAKSYTTPSFIEPQSTDEQTYDSYTIPNIWAEEFTTAPTGLITATLTTYASDDTELGTRTKTFTVLIPDVATFKPTVIPSVSEISDNVTIESWQIPPSYTYIAGFSRIVLSATGSTIYGSSIADIAVTGSATAHGYPFSVTTGIQTAGTRTFTFVATDSRGLTSAPVTVTVSVYPYSAPQVTSFTAEREADPNITVVDALGTWTWSNVGSNTYTKSLQYRQSTSQTWLTASGDISSGTVKQMNEIFTDSVSYYIRLTITDALGNSDSRTVYVPTINVWMHYPVGGLGVSFGKTSETGGFEVNYDMDVYGDANVLGDISANDATFADTVLDSLIVDNLDFTITSEDYLELARLVAGNYSPLADYFEGQWCKNNGKVWEATQDITAEAWDATHWEELGNEVAT